MIALILRRIPKFLSKGWIKYLRDCSDMIERKKFGYTILKHKLVRAGYQIGNDGTVYPF